MKGSEAVGVIERVYACLAAGDLDGYLALVHDDVVITQDEALPWGGRHVGRDGVVAFAIALVGAIDSRVTIEALFAADDRVVQFGRTKGAVRATGVPFDIPECHVWTVRHGKVAEGSFFIDTAAMIAALTVD